MYHFCRARTLCKDLLAQLGVAYQKSDLILDSKLIGMALQQTAINECVLHVCTSCRPSGHSRNPATQRPGYRLYEKLFASVQQGSLAGRVEVKPAQCLSLCPRPCGIAVSAHNSWTYLFGDQDPNVDVTDILNCLQLYLQSGDGMMPRRERPASLQASVLGRLPPPSHNYEIE